MKNDEKEKNKTMKKRWKKQWKMMNNRETTMKNDEQ